MLARIAPFRDALEAALPDRPFAVRFWDGSELPATRPGGPVFTLRSSRAVAHMLLAPGQLGLGRAYVSGELDVDDLDAVMGLLGTWEAPPLDAAARLRLAGAAARAAGLQRPPRPPRAELRPRGRRHSVARDARAVRHHYDLPPEFFSLFLDEGMTYSCAIFADAAQSLEEAQANKLETVCRKLALRPGERVLDVGCGWGSFVVHAAREHGVHAVGITLSEPQARRARERAAAAGVADRVEIRVADYRDLRGERFDAVASIGMVEHVGPEMLVPYARTLAGLLEPGGRLLNHGIARLRPASAPTGAFSERYVFPDALPPHLSAVQAALEEAGFTTQHVEGYAEHYERTLTHWIERFDANLERAEQLAGPERVRVWRVYLRAARNGFRIAFTSIYQVRAVRAAA